MGVWGTRNFENDHAYNWLSTFFDNPTKDELEGVFEYVLEQEDFLDNIESHATIKSDIGK